MLFPTITFAFFFLVVYALNWVLMPRLRLWKWFIIAASYVFYGWWDWRLIFLLVCATLVNVAAGVQVHRALGGCAARGPPPAAGSSSPWPPTWCCSACSSTSASSPPTSTRRSKVFGIPVSPPLLRGSCCRWASRSSPSGMLSYVIDVYRGELAPAPPLDFAVYLSFFPTCVAGPIVRAREFLPQLTSPRPRNAWTRPRGVRASSSAVCSRRS